MAAIVWKFISRLLLIVMNVAKTRQQLAQKSGLLAVNAHFEPIFNADFARAIVKQPC